MLVAGLYIFVGNSGRYQLRPYRLHVPRRLYDGLVDHPAGDEVRSRSRACPHGSSPYAVAVLRRHRRSPACSPALFALIVGRDPHAARPASPPRSPPSGLLGGDQQRLFQLGLRDRRQGSIVGIPGHHERLDRRRGAAVAIAIAYLYSISRSGLALRAARDEAMAASASGIDIVRERLIAFVVSAFVIGLAGRALCAFPEHRQSGLVLPRTRSSPCRCLWLEGCTVSAELSPASW